MIPLRGFLVPLIAALVLIATCTHSRAADLPQVDCATIRYYVAEHGKAAALAWAIRNGYSWAEIREARRCLG
jgi:hypothetical protein